MGFYDSYRTRVECGKLGSEKAKDDIIQNLKDNFYELPNCQSVSIEGVDRNVHISNKAFYKVILR